MSRVPIQPTLPTFDGAGGQVPLLLVDGHNLLWGATFGFPAPIYSRDKTRLLTGLFAFFALLRAAIRDDVPGAAPEIIVIFDGEHGGSAVNRLTMATRPAGPQTTKRCSRCNSCPTSNGAWTTAVSPGSSWSTPKPTT